MPKTEVCRWSWYDLPILLTSLFWGAAAAVFAFELAGTSFVRYKAWAWVATIAGGLFWLCWTGCMIFTFFYGEEMYMLRNRIIIYFGYTFATIFTISYLIYIWYTLGKTDCNRLPCLDANQVDSVDSGTQNQALLYSSLYTVFGGLLVSVTTFRAFLASETIVADKSIKTN